MNKRIHNLELLTIDARDGRKPYLKGLESFIAVYGIDSKEVGYNQLVGAWEILGYIDNMNLRTEIAGKIKLRYYWFF